MSKKESSIDNDDFDFESLMALMSIGSGTESIGAVMNSCPELIKKLERYCPVTTAAVFGGLLFNPRFHRNCLRLEYLIHISVTVGNGLRTAPYQDLISSYSLIGEHCGYLEDPPEDLFAHRVHTRRGNYNILDGIWEGAGFYLQRFMNLVDSMPDYGLYQELSNSVHSLLKISDFICSRANIKLYDLSSELGEGALSGQVAAEASALKKMVSLTPEDLKYIGVDYRDIEVFIFSPSDKESVRDQVVGNSELERKPLAMLGSTIYLILPTAISIAVRSLCISTLGSRDSGRNLSRNLGREYSRLISFTRMLGGEAIDASPSYFGDEAYFCVQQEIDAGRYLNVVFVMDTLQEFSETGFSGYGLSEILRSDIQSCIDEMQVSVSASPDFRGGITLLVSCGIGRGALFQPFESSCEGWRFAFVSVYDFYSLSNISQFEPLRMV